MKKISFILIFVLAILGLTSCEKEDESLGSGLRIKKIIDNDGIESIVMEFTYNAEGLVTEIKEGNFLLDIDYDETNRPISVGEPGGDYYGIDWGINEFAIYYLPSEFIYYKSVFKYNSKNQITELIEKSWDAQENDYEITRIRSYNWHGEDSLSIVATYGIYEDEVNIYYKFNKGISPFKNINIAILAAFPLEYYYGWGERQNLYCTKNHYIGNHRVTTLEYEFNKHNYPTKAYYSVTDDVVYDGTITFIYE